MMLIKYIYIISILLIPISLNAKDNNLKINNITLIKCAKYRVEINGLQLTENNNEELKELHNNLSNIKLECSYFKRIISDNTEELTDLKILYEKNDEITFNNYLNFIKFSQELIIHDKAKDIIKNCKRYISNCVNKK